MLKLQKLMMVKTVKRKHEKITDVTGQVKENRLEQLSITFDDDEGIIMVSMENPTREKISILLNIDLDLITLETV